MKIEYRLQHSLYNLLYSPGADNLVWAVHSELNMYTGDESSAMKIWGWDPGALTDVERYKIDQLLRMFVFQRG
ncbi:hypothetical protein ACGFXC_31610 [Streptomyces sp. NPDC048507]|uniref:hypothetical protein n=1 Tax=Streptomyces sp. NPDC048507 TaxID=3365560 RepID=UPI003714592A